MNFRKFPVTRQNIGYVASLIGGHLNLISFAAVFNVINLLVIEMAHAVDFFITLYCIVSGCNMSRDRVAFNDDFHAASVAATSNSDAGIMLSRTYPSASSPTSAT